PGVKAGGLMQQTLVSLEVRCLPDSIPESITADVSALEIGDSIHVRDLILPAGVEAYVDEDRTVCSVIPPTVPTAEEEAAVEVPEEEPAEPELIKRPREEEEED